MYDIKIGYALQISGWMDFEELFWLAAQASKSKSICEIGSWQGRSTRALVDNTPGTVLAVDTWAGTDNEVDNARTTDPDALFQTFQDNMVGVPEGKLSFIRSLSVDAAKICKKQNQQFDMIFIDADHSYDAVKADILAWFPLLIGGGIICGHDYSYVWPGVVQAVNELFPSHVMCSKTIWGIGKPPQEGPLAPTYFVQHPDASFSVAEPQPNAPSDSNNN